MCSRRLRWLAGINCSTQPIRTEPVDGADGALKDSQESIDDPVGEPLGVVDLAGAEQGVERVVAGDDESSNVDEELASNVEEDEEEVEADEAEDGVDLGNGGLLLKVVEGGVLGQLDHSTVSARAYQNIGSEALLQR
jgi:hypothetical protein